MGILEKAFNQLGKSAGRELGKRLGPGFSVTFDSGGSVRAAQAQHLNRYTAHPNPAQPDAAMYYANPQLYVNHRPQPPPPQPIVTESAPPSAPTDITPASEPAPAPAEVTASPVPDLSALRTEISLPASMATNLDDLGNSEDEPQFQKADLQAPIQQPGKLHKGAKNDPEDVRNLQQMLKNIGMGDMLGKTGGKYDGVDGVFGDKTERAIIHFQTSMGLTPSGQVDAKTMQALMEKNSEVVLNQHSQPDAPRTPRRNAPGMSA